jgi:hypothetical protein
MTADMGINPSSVAGEDDREFMSAGGAILTASAETNCAREPFVANQTVDGGAGIRCGFLDKFATNHNTNRRT